MRWTKPSLVAEVELRGWTADGIVRHAVFKGLRQDKQAADVAAEKPAMETQERQEPASARPRCPCTLTHPDRVLWPDVGVTKQGLAEFYAEIWPWIAPHVVGRPLALVRCPGGIADKCFFQKHAWAGIGEHVMRSRDPEGGEELLRHRQTSKGCSRWCRRPCSRSTCGAPGSTTSRSPTGITFDLDPAPEVGWADVVGAALEVRDRLKRLGLDSFVKTTGGKGLHVVRAAQAACRLGRGEGLRPQRSPGRWPRTARSATWPSPRSRRARRRIFVDYLRNGRGATAVAAYSARARAGATVSTPLAWDELGPEMRPDRFSVLNLLHRLAHIDDPWKDMRKMARRLPSLTARSSLHLANLPRSRASRSRGTSTAARG